MGAAEVSWWAAPAAMAVVAAVCAALGLTIYGTGRLGEWLRGRVCAWTG